MEWVVKFKVPFLKFHFWQDTLTLFWIHSATDSGNTWVTLDCRQYDDSKCGEMMWLDTLQTWRSLLIWLAKYVAKGTAQEWTDTYEAAVKEIKLFWTH